jgi:CPA2 family monovalent cation:H+ antiporter-2
VIGLVHHPSMACSVRAVLAPLRDLFAAAFFLAIGLGVAPAALSPVLPAALALAAVTAATKMLTGAYVASWDKVGRRGNSAPARR